MSDYARAGAGGATHFGDKDALSTQDADKVIVGAQFDAEFNAILTAVNSKYDSDDIASQAQAEGETLDTVLMSPLAVAYWADNEAGVVGDLQDLTVAGFSAADALLGWDDSAAAAIGFTIGTGLTTTAGGALEMSLLGLEDLTDPGADRIVFWDDGAGISTWLTVSNGLEIDTTTLGLVDVATSATLPFTITSGTFAWDDSSVPELTATGLSQSGDSVLVSNAGVINKVPIDSMGWPIVSSDAAQNLQLTDMNTIQVHTSTTARTWTIRLDATDAGRVNGSGVLIINSNASADLTIQADTLVTLESRYHQGGVANASDVVRPGGTALLIKYATDHWVLTGDILDS